MHRSNSFRAIRLCLAVVCAGPSLICLTPPTKAKNKPEATEAKPRSDAADNEDEGKAKSRPALPEPVGAQRLSPRYPVWIDKKEKAVLVDGQICLREGMLEMFACMRNTKEHEAIVSADTKAYLVHAGLLRSASEVGHPCSFSQSISRQRERRLTCSCGGKMSMARSKRPGPRIG